MNRNSVNYGLELSFGPYLPSLVYCKPKLEEYYARERSFQPHDKPKQKRSVTTRVTDYGKGEGSLINLEGAKQACKQFGIGWKVTRQTNNSLVCSKVSWLLNCHKCDTWRLLVWKDGACEKLIDSKCNQNMTKAGEYYCGNEPCQRYGNLRYGGKWGKII